MSIPYDCLAKVLWTGQTKNCTLSVGTWVRVSVCVPCLVRHPTLTRMKPVSCQLVYDLAIWSSSSPCPKKIIWHAPPVLGGVHNSRILPMFIVAVLLLLSWLLLSAQWVAGNLLLRSRKNVFQFSLLFAHNHYLYPFIFVIIVPLCQTSCPLRTVHCFVEIKTILLDVSI